MLGKDVLKRRVEAARILRGLSQPDLDKRFAKDGLGKTAAGRVERGELDMQRAHRDAFCRHLGVPERWFSEPDVDVVVGLRPAELSVDEVRATLEQLLAGLDQDEAQASRGTTRARADVDHQDPPRGAARS